MKSTLARPTILPLAPGFSTTHAHVSPLSDFSLVTLIHSNFHCRATGCCTCFGGSLLLYRLLGAPVVLILADISLWGSTLMLADLFPNPHPALPPTLGSLQEALS